MFKKQVVFTFIAAFALLFAVAGCGTTPTNEDLTDPVPEAVDDPSGLNSMRGDDFGRGGKWVDSRALADVGGDADGWTLADPSGNRLGMPIIYFAYDSDVLVPSETANLDKIAAYLQRNASLALVIQGHCDNRGTDEYNRALGERRANAIRAYLAGCGVADSRMKTMSYGKDQPAVEGSGESIWRQNRRGVPVPMHMAR